MTKQEAIYALRKYKRQTRTYNHRMITSKNNVFFRTDVYRDFVIQDLINRIRDSDEDPILIATKLYCDFDYILGESDDDQFELHNFFAEVEYEMGKIMRMLKDVEKEIRHEQKH